MNTYKKYCPNVFVAMCDEKQEKGNVVSVTTKRGKENLHVIHNFVGYAGTKENPKYCYSITRADGYNAQEHAKKKAGKLEGYAENADKRSDEYYKKSNKDRDFLSLAEPIKVGHHSEKRHRKIIEDAYNNMGKCVAESDKADEYRRRAEYWESKADIVNLSIPESLDYYEFELQKAKLDHKDLKENPEKRAHAYSLTYANKRVKEMQKNVQLAVKLWGSADEIDQINKEAEEKAQKKARAKGKGVDSLISQHGGFWFFGSDSKKFKEKYRELIESGHIEEGDKITNFGMGLYVPSKHKEIFKKELKLN